MSVERCISVVRDLFMRNARQILEGPLNRSRDVSFTVMEGIDTLLGSRWRAMM
jgi:hypothetical protein